MPRAVFRTDKTLVCYYEILGWLLWRRSLEKCDIVTLQYLRGVVGIGCIVIAIIMYPFQPPLTVVLLAVSVYFLRGCPFCWLANTLEIISETKKSNSLEESTAIEQEDAGQPKA